MSTATLASETVERPRGVSDYLSPSRLNLWLRCPLALTSKIYRRDPASVDARVVLRPTCA